ncbi:MAG: IS1595 family transposase [Candidatus Sulfotelmatobacter sp.]
MTLVDVINLFDTDEKCRELLVRLRWPSGIECLRCKAPVVELATAKQLFYCKDCDYQFSVTASTIFNDSHLPLQKWFLATLLLCEARKGMSANQIKRTLGVSYKTAWYLCHRIRAAMKQVGRPMMDGTVEMDETYVGGKRRGACIRGRGAEKEVVIGIRQRSGDLRFFHAKDAKSATLAEYIRENVSEDVDVIVTDEWSAYPDAMRRTDNVKKHKTIRHKGHVYVDGDIYTNTVESAFSLLKRGIMGTWHKISAKHLQSYLDEMTFRFDRRKRSDLFIDTLRHMVTAPVLTFERLTAQ